jgi:DNA modification methylase
MRVYNSLMESMTNSEKKSNIYDNPTKPPTKAKCVTHDTPLMDLNLNWTEKDLPEKERTKHVNRLHPYLGKFIPQLVEVFLRKYFSPGDTILDPFAGSCTTLVQCQELGINSIGFDISAFNVLLGKVKTDSYDIELLKNELLDILDKIKVARNVTPELFSYSTSIDTHTDDEYLLKWFGRPALDELLAYKQLIGLNNYKYADVMTIILSRSARSARLTTHFDLDFPKIPQTEPYECYKHRRICQPTMDALKFLNRYTLDTIRRIEEYSKLRSFATVQIIHGDSRNSKIPKIDGVITSPPYVGLIDYHAQHEYAYHLLNLEDKRNLEIGPAINGNGKKAKLDYTNDIALVLKNCLSSMKKGGRLIIVANDRSDLYPEIAEQLDVETEDVLKRHVNRRTGRRTSEFFESIFVWSKR